MGISGFKEGVVPGKYSPVLTWNCVNLNRKTIILTAIGADILYRVRGYAHISSPYCSEVYPEFLLHAGDTQPFTIENAYHVLVVDVMLSDVDSKGSYRIDYCGV
jgi:hypothetical protein